MSTRGEANKHAGDIARAISSIANSKMSDFTGMPKGTRKIVGYVCKIHEEGEFAGTIDVQEYGCEIDYEYNSAIGHHQGVRLSAIQDNKDGYVIIPQLFSDVMIVQNPYDGAEYVVMYSHAQKIQLRTHSLEGKDDGEITISVTETKDFMETDEGLENDYDELEETKNKTITKYTATNIHTQIASPDDEDGFQEDYTFENKTITVKDTRITIDGESLYIETTNNVTLKIGQTEVINEDGKVTIKTNECNIESQKSEIKGQDVTVNGTNVTITGGNLKTQGTCTPDMNGPYNSIMACPFSGAPHCGSMVSGT